jgi:Tol biopolymer transport system component
VLQRDKKTGEVEAGGRSRVKEVPLADIYLLPVDGGYSRQLTNFGSYSKPPSWSPDGSRLLGECDDRLLVMDLHTGNTTTVYQGSIYTPPLAAGDEYLGLPCWSPDGETILFARRSERETRLVLSSKDGSRYQEIFAVDGYAIGWDWSPDGYRVLVVGRNNDGFSGHIWLIDTRTTSARTLWEEGNYEYHKPVATWAPDNVRMVFR